MRHCSGRERERERRLVGGLKVVMLLCTLKSTDYSTKFFIRMVLTLNTVKLTNCAAKVYKSQDYTIILPQASQDSIVLHTISKSHQHPLTNTDGS